MEHYSRHTKDFVIELTLEYSKLSSIELTIKITDEQQIYVSESSVYQILKQRGLILDPIYVLISASNEFKDKTHMVKMSLRDSRIPKHIKRNYFVNEIHFFNNAD